LIQKNCDTTREESLFIPQKIKRPFQVKIPFSLQEEELVNFSTRQKSFFLSEGKNIKKLILKVKNKSNQSKKGLIIGHGSSSETKLCI